MYCVGLTGPIGSGKSTAAAYFATLGIDVISADEIAKQLTHPTQPTFHNIIQYFGSSALTSSGHLNRSYLRERIFNHPSERMWLEELLHPLIRDQIALKIDKVSSPYCIIEIPLLINKSHYPYLNRVLLIKARADQQIDRSIMRDKCSKEEIEAILAIQKNKHQPAVVADDLLMNTGTVKEFQDNLHKLHRRYLKFAERNEC